ncbi:NAD(P)-dependent dehydrogenase (short-subunit alcohol dehydrogenase family) [Kushneria sinocarnis]|uniref:NAD(P)-dependent dehydrogenase (Short-subunit alcohol dehydrogenase family) n=1 Tax=Kushneria sinocarnis TaxID=595502 RepID=A0A420WZL3_9GAMM|nr:SDR family oxidoreductase [Kushneria sinocarnis]RKR06786.1 NAD(P)-dependent dehydrogenase (short-subunit alcohol dehydrogenase family) [Kushneria sinocarnis]
MASEHALYPSLGSKTVFITGGGSGIGAALTRAFCQQGARVVFIDIAEDPSRQLVSDIERDTGNAPHFEPCDIRDIKALQEVIGRVEQEHGAIGVLVNNAARDDRHDWREVTPEYWDERMAINLRPQFFAIQAVAPQMERLGGGSIINFGSISWKLAQGNMPGYTTSKAAVHGLTRTMARDLGTSSIRVNTVIPGCIMTERQKELWIAPEDVDNILAHQCLKTELKPEHVAPTVLFLAADDSAQCTAQEYVIDGGWC